MHTDEQYREQLLLAKMAAGNREAFEEVYRNAYGGLLLFARRFLPLEQAEDVLAEVFIKLWQQRGTFPNIAALHSWLRVSVRNACLNILVQEKRRAEKRSRLHAASEEHYEHQYFRDKVQADLYRHLLHEVEKLHPQQQRIVRMFFLEEMDNAAIAGKLNISVQAVKNQKVTALKVLRQVFKGADLLLIAALFYRH